jgi:hypothetical protein
MQTSASTASSPASLVTPAVERVTEWHRERSLRQARALLEATQEDDPLALEDAPVPPGALRAAMPASASLQAR